MPYGKGEPLKPLTEVELLAFDPGGTTGWAWMSVDLLALVNGASVINAIQDWDAGQLVGSEPSMACEMIGIVERWPDAALVCEDFSLRKFNRSKVMLSPVRVTAMWQYALWINDDQRHVFFQMSSLAMTTLTDDRQRRAELWLKGEEHARDAVKHGYTFLDRASKNKKMRMVAWTPQRKS